MTNNKQSSIEWLQAIELERDLTLADWNKAREMHQDEIEAAAIISSAEQSTKEASEKSEAFSIGYVQGYNRALDLLLWQIKHKLKTK